MLSKILIANRGEIACRIIRTARKMGIATVAVYSEADAGALHVEMADEAVLIGPAQRRRRAISRSTRSWRRPGAPAPMRSIRATDSCRKTRISSRVEKAGLIFIGPSAKAIRAMGLKDAAKALMEKAGVPVVPGYHGEAQDAGGACKGKANEIGFPVLIKARAGGGGKGMRKVDAGGFCPARFPRRGARARLLRR
jgi:3-methylcrotonyl-CoA carboxylase alpha subunit